MQNYDNTTSTQSGSKFIQANEIKSLIQRQGRATFGDKEFVLKNPSPSDPKLQSIINDPSLSVKPVNSSSSNGQCEYELSANGKTVKITVDSKDHK